MMNNDDGGKRDLMDTVGQPPSRTWTAAPSPPLHEVYDPSLPTPPHLPLIGRNDVLASLRQRLCDTGNAALTVLNGLPGVGKTALSMTLVHDPDLRDHFQDGMLWAGLGPNPPVQSHWSRWGTLLGLSRDEMGMLKDSVDWAVALRRAIGSRRMLLVIDDAWTLEDALALKVGGPQCAHLVTTRFPAIASEITPEGATTIEELNSDEGLALLHVLAPEVVTHEMQRARELVVAVGGLPLALTLIGNYLRAETAGGPSQRVVLAWQKLNNASERLTLSESRDPLEDHSGLASTISLGAVIAMTDQQLAEPARRALHALSVFPPRPNSFSEEAALAIGQCTVETLDALADSGLLEINRSDRYTLHQTIADYARLQRHDPCATHRLIAYMTTWVETHRKDYSLLESESRNIFAALEAAAEEHTCTAELIRCIIAFAPFLLARGLYSTANTHLLRAYDATLATVDASGLAGVLLYLGETTWRRGDYEQAESYLQEGLTYSRKMDDHERICALLMNLGSISWKRGHYKRADAYLQEGLKLARQLENLERACHVLQVLGSVERMQGHYTQSRVHLQEGLTLARQIGEREATCPILLNLGVIADEQGNYEQAIGYLQEGLLLARQFHHSEWISGFLNNLGDVALGQGNYQQATTYFQEGLELARYIEHQEWVSFLLLNLGFTADKQKNYAVSERYFQESLLLARHIGIPQITCHALYGYGNVCLNQQLPDQAHNHFKEMLTLAPEGGQDFVALAQYGLARVASNNGNLEEAKELGEKSVRLLEGLGRREALEIRTWLWSLSRPTDEQ